MILSTQIIKKNCFFIKTNVLFINYYITLVRIIFAYSKLIKIKLKNKKCKY